MYSAIRSVLVDGLPHSWTVFPNPIASGEVLHIRTDEVQPYLFRLFGANGKMVLQEELKGDATIPMPELAKGTYLYEVISEKGRSRGKLVVD